MSAIIIDGKKTAAEIREQLKLKVDSLKEKGCTPHLSVVLVGEDPASKVYVGMKQKACDNIGMSSETIKLDVDTTEEYILDLVEKLKNDGVKVLSIEQAENSTMLNEFFPEENQKYAIVMGNEVKGVQQEVVSASNICIEIPQLGTKHSLNISVSCGVVLWDLFNKLK